MHPWQLIVPNLILSAPICSLTPELMAQHGLRGLILDVDDTLVGNSDIEASPEVQQWVDMMRQHYQIWLISNNLSNRRIQRVAESLNLSSSYRSRAGKPSRRVVREALNAMQLLPEQVAMVGDRLFTDTLAGNRLGMFTVLVQPVQPSANKKQSWLSGRSQIMRDWEFWLARLSGVNI
jgi:uncharacterized protein